MNNIRGCVGNDPKPLLIASTDGDREEKIRPLLALK
jgi:hypothetical protein